MTRTGLSFALAALLACSLTLKVSASLRGVSVASDVENGDIVAYLEEAGFGVKPPVPATDPPWYVGTSGKCHVEIATISPQGWHRAAVDWRTAALDGTSFYLQGGRIEAEQDILASTASYYWRRLQRYFGLPARDPVVRAVVVSGVCPEAMFGNEMLSRLSS